MNLLKAVGIYFAGMFFMTAQFTMLGPVIHQSVPNIVDGAKYSLFFATLAMFIVLWLELFLLGEPNKKAAETIKDYGIISFHFTSYIMVVMVMWRLFRSVRTDTSDQPGVS